MVDSIVNLTATTFGLGLGGGAGFFFIKWLFEYLGGRMDKRADRIDAGTDKLIENLQKQVEDLLAREKVREVRLAKVEDDLADCKRRHAESDAEVMRLKAIMQGRGEVRDRVQSIVAAEVLADRKGTSK